MILIIILSFWMVQNEITIFDTQTNSDNWYITNDTVMGGVSNSTIEIDENGHAVFSGRVSTDNNGGFAMTRFPVDVNFNENYSKIILKIKGDGKQYQLRLKSDTRQRYWFIQTFQTTNESQTITLNLNEFYASFRGSTLDIANFNANNISEVAILIGNKKNENFTLAIEKIIIK